MAQSGDSSPHCNVRVGHRRAFTQNPRPACRKLQLLSPSSSTGIVISQAGVPVESQLALQFVDDPDDHPCPEALTLGRPDGGTIALRPADHKMRLSARPLNSNLARWNGQSSVLDRVGRQLVQNHRNRLRQVRLQDKCRTDDIRAPCPPCAYRERGIQLPGVTTSRHLQSGAYDLKNFY